MVMTQRCPRCEQNLPQAAYYPRHRGKRGTYCANCWREYLRHYKRSRRPSPRLCSQPYCETRVKAPHAMCATHRRTRKPRVLSNTYKAVHARLQHRRGKAADYRCTCGQPAEEWAYDHNDPNELEQEWYGKTVRYSANLDHYNPLCRSCHSRLDNPYSGSKLQQMNEHRRRVAADFPHDQPVA